MKKLIISIYDSCCCFTYVVMENGKEIERSQEQKDLTKYGLYDENWHWFEEALITDPLNTKIKDFDMIIVCEDGCIKIYKPKNQNEVEE